MSTSLASRPRPAGAAGLLRRALASDLVDRLAAPHGIDRYLELVDPRWVVREVRAEVIAAVRQTADTVTLTLRPSGAWAGFQAGQHVVVGVTIAGVVHRRCFSLAGSPARPDGAVELTVKASPSGRVSRHLVDHAAPGMVLHLSQAQGDFVLPSIGQRTRHLLFVSGGSGITPVLSMLRALVDEGHRGPVTFLHYALTPADLCYEAELSRLVNALPEGRLLLGFPEAPGAGDLDGLFGAEHVAAVTDDPADLDVYLCGPAPLMAAVEAHWDGLGLAERVHLERFGPTPVDPALLVDGAVVTFAVSGATVAAQGTLLETAEAAGLRPATGCRRGICGTCTTPRRSGVVRDINSGASSEADAGPVRLCTSVPCGEVVVDL